MLLCLIMSTKAYKIELLSGSVVVKSLGIHVCMLLFVLVVTDVRNFS